MIQGGPVPLSVKRISRFKNSRVLTENRSGSIANVTKCCNLAIPSIDRAAHLASLLPKLALTGLGETSATALPPVTERNTTHTIAHFCGSLEAMRSPQYPCQSAQSIGACA